MKAEKSSDSTPRSSDKELPESNTKKSNFEMEKTIFTLKRIIEKLQAENKRLKFNFKKNNFIGNQVRINFFAILYIYIYFFYHALLYILYIIFNLEKDKCH